MKTTTIIFLLIVIGFLSVGWYSQKASLHTPQTIRELQQGLIDLGYDCGCRYDKPDGRLGTKTLTSWKEWDKLRVPKKEQYE